MSFSELSAVVAIGGIIFALFRAADARLRQPYQASLASWIGGESSARVNWGTPFVGMFDAVFGVRPRFLLKAVPLPSLWLSAMWSTASVAALYVVFFSILPDSIELDIVAGSNPTQLIPFDLVYRSGDSVVAQADLEFFIILPFLVNIVPDYLSLCQTRLVLSRLKRSESEVRRLVWAVGDAILTFAMALIAYSLIRPAYFSIKLGDPYWEWVPREATNYFSTLLVFNEPLKNQDAAWIYSTFLTSAWLWLFLLGGWLFRFLHLFPAIVRSANRLLDLDEMIEQHPGQVLGSFVAVLFVFASASWLVIS